MGLLGPVGAGVPIDVFASGFGCGAKKPWSCGAQKPKREQLRRHAHLLGFRGHFATKSRSYSTTFTALRAEREHWAYVRAALHAGADPDQVAVVGDWRPTGGDAR